VSALRRRERVLEAAGGILAGEPNDAIRRFTAAVERLEALEMQVDVGRALLDLGRAERRAGRDPNPSFKRAKALLLACDAQRYVREAEGELGT
jgi:hypothetical protein